MPRQSSSSCLCCKELLSDMDKTDKTEEHYIYAIIRYGKDYEAQRALRVRTIHTFFHRHKITVAGAEHMGLEELGIKYQLAKLFMYRRLVQERFMVMEREEGESTCIITEIADDQDTPWYYRLIPCCSGTQKVITERLQITMIPRGIIGLFHAASIFRDKRSLNQRQGKEALEDCLEEFGNSSADALQKLNDD